MTFVPARDTFRGGSLSAADRTYLPRFQTGLCRLSRHDEEQLVARAKHGDQRAIETLVASVSALVLRTARRFRCQSHGVDDLYQEGVVGLLTAIRHFDARRGYRLSTYALYWVHQSISRAVTLNDRLIHVPGHAQTDIRQLLRVREAMEAQQGRTPTDAELAAACGLSEDRVRVLLETVQDVQSLDERVGANADDSILELVVDSNATDPVQELLWRADCEQLGRAIAKLAPREQRVIRGRFGLDGGEVRTLEELSQELRVSRERVRQIERLALERLRRSCATTLQ